MTQTSSGKTQGSLNIINVKNTLKACSIRVKQGVWGLLAKLEFIIAELFVGKLEELTPQLKIFAETFSVYFLQRYPSGTFYIFT